MIRVFLAAILALVPVTASAVPVLWTISGTVFQNEIGVDQNGFPFSIQPETATVPVTGSFVFDADTQAFSDSFVEVDIALSDPLGDRNSVSGVAYPYEQFQTQTGAVYQFTFGFDTSGLDPQQAISVATTEPVATFFLTAPLTDAGGTLTASFGFGPPLSSAQYSGEVTLTGTPTAVPLPAGGVLLLAGLLSVGTLRRRQPLSA